MDRSSPFSPATATDHGGPGARPTGATANTAFEATAKIVEANSSRLPKGNGRAGTRAGTARPRAPVRRRAYAACFRGGARTSSGKKKHIKIKRETLREKASIPPAAVLDFGPARRGGGFRRFEASSEGSARAGTKSACRRASSLGASARRGARADLPVLARRTGATT